MHGPASGGHVPLTSGAVHARTTKPSSDWLRVVLQLCRLLGEGDKPPTAAGVKLGVGGRRGGGRGWRVVREAERSVVAVDSVDLGTTLGAAALTLTPSPGPTGGGAGWAGLVGGV